MVADKFVYGAAKASNLSYKLAYKVVSKLYEHGLREMDTAPSYGNSESLIGSMQQDFPDLRINTKVGLDEKGAFTSDHIKRSAYESLQNLKVDTINTLFIHSVQTGGGIQDSALIALKQLKEQGVCKYIAYSGDGKDLQWALKKSESVFDAVMFSYNFLDQINLKYLTTQNNPQIYVKRVLANGVWRKRTLKDYIKDQLGRSRGHDEYRDRMNGLFPFGVVNGYSASINFVRESLPEAKYLIGISNLEQCNRLIDYLKLNTELTLSDQDDFKQVFKDYCADTYLGPVT